MKNIFIQRNNNENSIVFYEKLTKLLSENGCFISDELKDNTELVISIGGDGTFLNTISAIGFRSIPVLGINTGHLGFFSELYPDDTDALLDIIKNNNYILQKHKTIKTTVETSDSVLELNPALNDVNVRHWSSSLIHLNLSIGESFVESFCGDGVLVASSAGSTAYNYSLGGSIVDPRLDLLQITPVAPANNASFRSFTSSILVPSEQKIKIVPTEKKDAMVIIDGNENLLSDIKQITIELSEDEISIVRLPNYDFWNKVKSKFL